MSIEGLIVGLLAIVVGGAWALYGLKLFVILLPIWAAFFGLTVGAQWAHAIFGDGLFRTALSWVIGIAIGIGFALISYFWYYAAVTLAVGALGYALGVGILDYLSIDSSFLGLVVGLAVGAVFAVATFLLGVPIILVLLVSAITGAAGVVNGLLLIFGRIQVEDLTSGLIGGLLTDTVVGVVLWIVLAGVAIAYQVRIVGSSVSSIDRTSYRYA